MRALVSRLAAALALTLRFLVAPPLLAVLRRIARRGQMGVARVLPELFGQLGDLLHQHGHLLSQHRDLLLELADAGVLRRALRFEHRDALVLRDELALQLENALVSPIARHMTSIADLGVDGKLHEIMEQSGSLTRTPFRPSSCPVNGYIG